MTLDPRELSAKRQRFYAALKETSGIVKVGKAIKGRILIVDDDPVSLFILFLALEKIGCELVCVQSVALANKVILDSLLARKPFNLALIDLNMGKGERGDELARRILDIIPRINVALVTALYEVVGFLPFDPDLTVIKDPALFNQPQILAEKIRSLIRPKRKVLDSLTLQVRRWQMTAGMSGINSVKFITAIEGRKTEKLNSRVADKKNVGHSYWISTVVYPETGKEGNSVRIAVQSALGCTYRCKMCIAWRHHKNALGQKVPFVRPLDSDEITAQVYLAIIHSKRVRTVLEQKSLNNGITVNFTAEGEAMAQAFPFCMEAIKRLSLVENPPISFIVTSVGHIENLRKFIRKYIQLPRLTHYWSLMTLCPNSEHPLQRWDLMPGTANQDLFELRAGYQIVASETGRPVTISFSLFKGVNDSDEHARLIAEFCKSPLFRVKLMAGRPKSLKGVRDITEEEVQAFRDKLLALGLSDVRIRKIHDSAIMSGCGDTVAFTWCASNGV